MSEAYFIASSRDPFRVNGLARPEPVTLNWRERDRPPAAPNPMLMLACVWPLWPLMACAFLAGAALGERR